MTPQVQAVGEMRERAGSLVEHAAEVTIRTFHSFGAWMLRRNAEAAGLPRDFSIQEEDDVVTLPHALFPEHKHNSMARYVRLISCAKNYCLPADAPEPAAGCGPRCPRRSGAYGSLNSREIRTALAAI